MTRSTDQPNPWGPDEKGLVATNRKRRAAARRLAPIPSPADPDRRARCASDLIAFSTEYFPRRFPLAFSDDHRRMLTLAQGTILEGGQFAVALPRGSGKTTCLEVACLWAMLSGHRRFVFVVASDSGAAQQILDNLRAELEDNTELLADYPEACMPIVALDGVARRAESQAYDDGTPTRLQWTRDGVRLPCRAAAGGSAIRVAGITGRIRGAKVAMADGQQLRPDLVLVDDPQTDESARSPSQVATRLATLNGSVLGLAGPGQRIAALCACTVIERGDLSDQLLDRKANPGWQGFIGRLMHAMPTDKALWDRYAEILREDQRAEAGTTRATEFYREHRDAMDAGAKAAWPERFAPNEISAVQHAMNLRINRGEHAFRAEYQNDPVELIVTTAQQISRDLMVAKLNGHERGIVPIESTVITMAIDVQKKALYWMVVAWSQGFSGDVLAYGAYPDQRKTYFTLTDIERTMETEHPGGSWEASLFASLDVLVRQQAGRDWIRDDGSTQRIDQIIVDASFGDSTDTVFSFARRSAHGSIILPYFGTAVAAGETPMDQRKRKPGERLGPGWRISRVANRQTRSVRADANRWKSHVADRLLTPAGSSGSLSLYGDSVADHRMLIDHLCAEVRVPVTANGRTADEWRPKPNTDNHLLDTLSMCAIGASVRGITLDREAAIPDDDEDDRPASPAPEVDRPTPPRTPAPPKVRPIVRPRGGPSYLRGYGGGL